MGGTSGRRDDRGGSHSTSRTWFAGGRRGPVFRRLACLLLALALVVLVPGAIACAAGDRPSPAADRSSPTRTTPQAAGSFSIVDLGTLGGGCCSSATAVNDAGQVVGESKVDDYPVFDAFSWTQAGGIVDIGGLGLTNPATAVNDNGQVVGYGIESQVVPHAFSWTPAGGLVDLAPGKVSRAVGVNDAGQVVGDIAPDPFSLDHAFSWTQAGGIVDSARSREEPPARLGQ